MLLLLFFSTGLSTFSTVGQRWYSYLVAGIIELPERPSVLQ
jgi:hypothetical protein